MKTVLLSASHIPLPSSVATLGDILFWPRKAFAVCLFIFFHLTSLLLFFAARHSVSSRRAGTADKVWRGGENARWPRRSLLFTVKLRSRRKYSAQVFKKKIFKEMCRPRCHRRASVESPELEINQSANSQMSWLLILKWLALVSTLPQALLLCFEMISLDFDIHR